MEYLPAGTWEPYKGAPRIATHIELASIALDVSSRLARLNAILADGAAHNEPDSFYAARYSTLGKNPLRRGDTWRGRMQRHAAALADWLAKYA